MYRIVVMAALAAFVAGCGGVPMRPDAAPTSPSAVAAGPAPRVVFQINVAEDAPTILRLQTREGYACFQH